MIFAAEALAACILFTAMVLPMVYRNPLDWISDYPPVIRQRCREIGLIPQEQMGLTRKELLRKGIGCLVIVILLSLILIFINGAGSFSEGFLISYGLWLIVDWYDAFIIDCLWFCHSKRVILPGTEDLISAYRDYWFHIRMSMIGMLLGLPVCLLTGLAVMLFA